MIDLEEYLAYHKRLAELHAEIKHVDGKKIGWVGMDHSEFDQTQSSSKMGEVIMAMDVISGEFVPEESENLMEVLAGGFFLWCRVTDPNMNFRKQEEAMAKAKRIGAEILARIVQETGDFDMCPRTFRPMADSFRYRASMYKNHYMGWSFTYALSPVDEVVHSAGNWTDNYAG